MTEKPDNHQKLTRAQRRKAAEQDESYAEIAKDAIVGSPSDAEVVFIGPVGVGKTTAVQTLSTVPPINTEVVMLDGAEEFEHTSKTTTTVGIDYGMWVRPDGHTIGLFGTTGQARFTDSRTPLLNPDAAIVIWLYGNRDSVAQDLQEWLEVAGGAANSHRIVVAINYPTDAGVAAATTVLSNDFSAVRLTTADPRNVDDVRRVVNDALTFMGV